MLYNFAIFSVSFFTDYRKMYIIYRSHECIQYFEENSIQRYLLWLMYVYCFYTIQYDKLQVESGNICTKKVLNIIKIWLIDMNKYSTTRTKTFKICNRYNMHWEVCSKFIKTILINIDNKTNNRPVPS